MDYINDFLGYQPLFKWTLDSIASDNCTIYKKISVKLQPKTKSSMPLCERFMYDNSSLQKSNEG